MKIILLISLLGYQFANACDSKFDVSFKADLGAPENLVVVMNSKQQILDDDGYLSAYLTYVQIVKSTTGKFVDKGQNWRLIGFMIHRINLLRTRLLKIPLPPGDSELRNTVNLLWADADNFLKILSSNPIELDAFKTGFERIKWSPQYSQRTNAYEDWQDPKKWSDLFHCPITVSSFKLPSNYGTHNISRDKPKENRPSTRGAS